MITLYRIVEIRKTEKVNNKNKAVEAWFPVAVFDNETDAKAYFKYLDEHKPVTVRVIGLHAFNVDSMDVLDSSLKEIPFNPALPTNTEESANETDTSNTQG